jgi:multicomponent Na+:H+ antiporter subunit G
MTVQTIAAFVFIVSGLFFLLVSSIGILRLPDFYTRCHAIGKSETLGSMLLLMGLAIYNGLDINSFKLTVILLFIAFANPTATHIVIGVALKAGVQPWTLKNRKASADSFAEEEKTEGFQPGQDK